MSDNELILKKATLIMFSGLMSVGGIIWGILALSFGSFYASIIPFSYTFLAISNIGLFRFHKNFTALRIIQLLLSMLLPFFFQLSLGGFSASGAVIIWSFTAIYGAIVYTSKRESFLWGLLFIVLLVIAGLLDQHFQRISQKLSVQPWILFLVNIGLVASIVFLSTSFFVNSLRKEHDKSENLLLNILPRSIADRLKIKEETIADGYTNATVLFADVVGFTNFSNNNPPEKVVNYLNEIFSKFDDLLDTYEIEKIKTIGDAYMVVSGVPVHNASHAENIANFALEMQKIISAYEDKKAVDGLSMRIGISSGPVVAGVIGKKKFIFDLWGDTVNTASRMESNSKPGKIHISQMTHTLLKNNYRFKDRGKIQIKGKGKMQTFFLEGKKV